MKRKHILSVVLIGCIIYLPFLLGLLQLMIINFTSSRYIFSEAEIKNIEMNHSRAYIVTIEYVLDQNILEKEVSYRMGDCIGQKIPIAISRNTKKVYRNQITLEYEDISLFIVGVCLLLIENYAYTNKKKRYEERKRREH